MNEEELNSKIAEILENNPSPDAILQRKYSGRGYRRHVTIQKEERLYRASRYPGYNPTMGWVPWEYQGKTLHHSGYYLKYPKNSNHQRWLKRQSAKRVRRNFELPRKGNKYRRALDYYWKLW